MRKRLIVSGLAYLGFRVWGFRFHVSGLVSRVHQTGGFSGLVSRVSDWKLSVVMFCTRTYRWMLSSRADTLQYNRHVGVRGWGLGFRICDDASHCNDSFCRILRCIDT